MSRLFFVITLAVLHTAVVGAQTGQRLDDWLRNRIEAKIAAAHPPTDTLLVEANSNRAIRQKESPAGDARSTSLVDQSSASDFVDVALALAPVSTGASSTPGNAGTGVVTASAYSLLAMFNKKSLTDPEFYKAHTGARQLSFSLGSTASDMVQDNTDKPGTTVGFKYTLLNDREIYSRRNQKLLGDLQAKFSTVTAVETKVNGTIQIMLFCAANADGIADVNPTELTSFCAKRGASTLSTPLRDAIANYIASINGPTGFDFTSLPESTLKQVDALIDANLETFASLRAMINSTYDQIKQGRQLALTATYINRPDLGTDDFRSTLVFDYGLAPRLNWTVNGSFDHRNRKVGFDTRGGRFATEFLARLTGYSDDLWGRQPITLAFAGEGKWLTRQKPQYSVQAKLTFPITAGIDLPIVYRWAKRIDLVDQEGKELKLGFTVDVGNLSQLLKGK
jgi:hypothetical protein